MPLTGKHILVTQAEGHAEQLINMLRDLGAEIIHKPVIAIYPPDDFAEIDKQLLDDRKFDWIIFTSKNGVEAFGNRISALELDRDNFSNTRFAVIGDSTADELKKYGFDVGFKPDLQTSEGFLAGFDAPQIELNTTRILFPAGNIAHDTIPNGLRKKGAEVVRVTAYRTVPIDYPQEEIEELFVNKKIDIAVFTSSSTVDNLFRLLHREDKESCVRKFQTASIGPSTTKTLRHYGIEPVIEAEHHSFRGLVDALKNFYS